MGVMTSGAKTLQNFVLGAHIFKAFNTVLAQHMSTGSPNG
jgi:predicted dinucleotide-binding enzyme